MSYQFIDTMWAYLLSSLCIFVVIPFTLVILYRTECKQLLYLQLKRDHFPPVPIDTTCPQEAPTVIENNYKLVGVYGQTSVKEKLGDALMGV